MNLALRLLASASTVLLAAPLAASADPFRGDRMLHWVHSVDAAKPLRLEICFAELTYDPAQNAMDLITPEFLASAKTLRIAVAPDDQGRVEAPDQLAAVYRLKTKANEHALDINFIIGGENHREIASSVTVSEQWIVFGGLTRTEVVTHLDGTSTDTRKNLVIAMRLVPAKP